MEIPRDDRQPAPRALALVAAVTALGAALAIAALDRPLAQLLARYEPLPIWNVGIEGLEWLTLWPVWPLLLPIALAVGMLATVAVPPLRHYAHAWIFLAGTHLVARLATTHLKDATDRIRPHKWLRTGGDTFFRDGGAAFPSGHVVLFSSLAIAIAVLVPRLRTVMIATAAFVVLARVAVNDHWLSDALASISLVTGVAYGLGWLVRPRASRAR